MSAGRGGGGALLALLLACIGRPAWSADLPAQEALVQAGERIYRQGIGVSGAPVRAELMAGVPVPADQASCIGCHRPSGMGSIEGPILVPSVAGGFLYRPGKDTAVRFGRSYERRAVRPAYTDDTLARAIREGVDPGGQPILPPMPRFALDDADMAALTAYLKSLSAAVTPGVGEREIHLATVVTDGVSAERRRAMVEVLEAYLAERNGANRSQSRQTAPGVWTITERRSWRLHVWELTGAADTWPAQLAEHYARQPVFALVGGVAAGPWQPIHEFCEDRRVPCLFPSTDLPTAEAGRYALYFSRGMVLEAEALALHLRETDRDARVLQIVDDDARSVAAAAALGRALRRQGMAAPEERRVADLGDASAWARLLRRGAGTTLVLWLNRPDLAALADRVRQVRRVVVSSTLLDAPLQVPGALRGRVAAVHPFVLPERRESQLSALRTWLRLKGIRPGDERVQADAYAAADTAARGLAQIGETFSREYLLERIEDTPAGSAVASVYPRLSFGPGQRYASKGAYLLNLPSDGTVPEAGDWVLP